MIQKRIVPVCGFSSLGTEVWELPATAAPVAHVCIVPGNPGAAGYYSTFMDYLHRAFDGKVIVTSVASLGFHTEGSEHHKNFRTFTLEMQCKHKAAYLQQYVFPSHDLPVVVMGHSIGIYMAMQAVRQCERDGLSSKTRESFLHHMPENMASQVSPSQSDHNRVIQLIGLMPFLHTCPRHPVQRRLRFLASVRVLLGMLATFFILLPRSVRQHLAVVGGGKMDKESVNVTAALLRPDAVRVAFTLAHHEFSDLDDTATDGWHDFEHFASQQRMAVLAAPDDAWWPQAHHDRALRLLPEELIEMQPDQAHAFCTQPGRCLTAAAACKRWISSALAQHAPPPPGTTGDRRSVAGESNGNAGVAKRAARNRNGGGEPDEAAATRETATRPAEALLVAEVPVATEQLVLAEQPAAAEPPAVAVPDLSRGRGRGVAAVASQGARVPRAAMSAVRVRGAAVRPRRAPSVLRC